MVVVHVVVVVVVSARARRVGELDGDGFTGAVWNETVELLDRPLSLVTQVEPHEPDALRQTYTTKQLQLGGGVLTLTAPHRHTKQPTSTDQ